MGAAQCFNNCAGSNKVLMASLREDVNDVKLHQIALDDWAQDRMSEPVRASDMDTSQVRVFITGKPLLAMCFVAGPFSAKIWGRAGC